MSASAAQAAGIAWHGNLQAAAQQAATQRKPLLVMVKASWCGPCHKMLKQTFPDPALAARINSHFIPVLLDADQQAATVQALGVSAMPTVIIMTPERKVAGRFTGFQSAAQLDARLAALSPAPIRQFAPPQIRRWGLPSTGQSLAYQPPVPRQYGASFLQRHAIASLPARPLPFRSGPSFAGPSLPRPGLSESPFGAPAYGAIDTLTAAREFSATGSTPAAAAHVAPVPNPPD
jgi:thiol-disulfide isomerase/thioredoxin